MFHVLVKNAEYCKTNGNAKDSDMNIYAEVKVNDCNRLVISPNQKTSKKPGTAHPRWNETLSFEVDMKKYERLGNRKVVNVHIYLYSGDRTKVCDFGCEWDITTTIDKSLEVFGNYPNHKSKIHFRCWMDRPAAPTISPEEQQRQQQEQEQQRQAAQHDQAKVQFDRYLKVIGAVLQNNEKWTEVPQSDKDLVANAFAEAKGWFDANGNTASATDLQNEKRKFQQKIYPVMSKVSPAPSGGEGGPDLSNLLGGFGVGQQQPSSDSQHQYQPSPLMGMGGMGGIGGMPQPQFGGMPQPQMPQMGGMPQPQMPQMGGMPQPQFGGMPQPQMPQMGGMPQPQFGGMPQPQMGGMGGMGGMPQPQFGGMPQPQMPQMGRGMPQPQMGRGFPQQPGFGRGFGF